MLQDDQVTSAPRAVSVSMRTAVWMARHEKVSKRNFNPLPLREPYSCGDTQQCERPSRVDQRHIWHAFASNQAFPRTKIRTILRSIHPFYLGGNLHSQPTQSHDDRTPRGTNLKQWVSIFVSMILESSFHS